MAVSQTRIPKSGQNIVTYHTIINDAYKLLVKLTKKHPSSTFIRFEIHSRAESFLYIDLTRLGYLEKHEYQDVTRYSITESGYLKAKEIE